MPKSVQDAFKTLLKSVETMGALLAAIKKRLDDLEGKSKPQGGSWRSWPSPKGQAFPVKSDWTPWKYTTKFSTSGTNLRTTSLMPTSCLRHFKAPTRNYRIFWSAGPSAATPRRKIRAEICWESTNAFGQAPWSLHGPRPAGANGSGEPARRGWSSGLRQ